MLRGLAVAWIFFLAAGVAVAAEDLEFRAPAAADGAETAAAMRSLAVRALPVYENPSREQFLTNLSALQMVAGEYAAAYATRESLRELRRREKDAREVDEELIYDLYARARATAAKRRLPFDQAFAQVFHETVSPLDDLDAYTVTEWLATPLSVFAANLQRELDRLRGRNRISLSEAVDLTWTYLSFEAFQSFGPLVGRLVAEDDDARYVIDDHAFVTAPGHAALAVAVARPKSASARIPALFELTIRDDPHGDARESAAHGYAGVVAYVRAASEGPGASAADDRDGDDARVVIDWIAAQPWSDGRVGMYGSGYGALAAWAAAKRSPPALKALAVSSAEAPGFEAPSEAHAEGLPDALYHRWQQHPSLDQYWQKRLPYQKDFARIDFPVLTTTGYYDQDEAGALYYFTERAHYDPQGSQTLLVGPYDGHAMQRGPLPVLAGYPVDEAAIVDLHELRYRWFDHVLKGAPSPDPLQERVNFEVMGANAWRHAASLEAMANGAVRLYLDRARAGSRYRLSGHEPSGEELTEQPIDTAGADGGSGAMTGVMTRVLPRRGVVFVSGPLHRPLQVSGRISGQLVLAPSRGSAPVRGGVALALRLYELRPSGEYLQLFAPPEALCAGCKRGQGSRHPGEQRLDFQGDRLTSVELQTGSRIVLVIEAHAPDDASAGSATPARRPSRRRASAKAVAPEVTWYGGSYIELPVWR